MTATEPTEAVTGVPFTLNGKELTANEGELLIDACERHGEHIPRFCYHPRMEPVGMCRMCLVEVDTGRGPALAPSCMISVTPDMKVDTKSEATAHAQDAVLELTLINHPLDCPVCDKGGECPLQDNAYSYGPGESRFVEEKRHYEKPIPISDLVYLDRERCILCDRCTRFASDVAGDPLIHFIDRGNETQVNTFPDHPFSSYFSGNTVQICPVGALTAQPYRFKARPWDLAENESTATIDATGSRIVQQSSRDEMVRILGVDSDAVNWSWLSDKERFTYEANNSDQRITEPLVRGDNGELTNTRWSSAAAAAAQALAVEAASIGVIGGARMSLEGQYAWSKLTKSIAGARHVDAQLGDGLPASAVLGLTGATIAEAAEANGVIVLLSADPKEELPTLFIRLRHAAVSDGASIIEMTPRATGLNPQAAASLFTSPGSVADVAAALADGKTGEPVGGVNAASLAKAHELLTSGRPVTVVLGRPNLAESPDYVLAAAERLRQLAPEARFLSALRRGNVHGALEMGLTPEFDMGGNKTSQPGLDTAGILAAAAEGSINTLVLLGADPLSDFPDRALAAAALDAVPNLIAVDAFLTQSSARASVFLPVALAGEINGSFLNLEGRLSPLTAKVTAPGQARTDWMIAAELALAADADLGFGSIEELRADLGEQIPSFGDVDWNDLVTAGDGPLIDRSRSWTPELPTSVGTAASDGYGLALVVDRKLWDLGTMVQQSASLADLAEPAVLSVAQHDFDGLGVESGASVTVQVADGSGAPISVELPIEVDAGLPRGSARIPFNLPGFDVGQLLSADRPVTNIRVTAN